MKYIRTNSLKRLFSLKRRSLEGEIPNPDGSIVEQNKDILKINALVPEPAHRPTWKCFSFEEIFDATNGFSSENLVGRGGYAEVYRGTLRDGEVIAVKRLTKASNDERKEKEFLTEIGTIGHVCHPNVLSLLGCCVENGLYLIFYFSSKGSVASILHDVNLPPVDWKTRYKIVIGTARGLHYLHKGCQRRIIHRDIKASNILLTTEFEPQISDFGLAKWLPSQHTHANTTKTKPCPSSENNPTLWLRCSAHAYISGLKNKSHTVVAVKMSGGATRFLTLLNTTNSFPLLLHHHHHHRLLLLRHQHKLLSHFHYHPLTLSPSSPIKQQQQRQLHTRSAALRTDHSPPNSHPWPEWSTLLHHLSLSHSTGYGFSAEDEFVAPGGLPDDFVRAATACLAFARQNPNILGLLSRRDIAVVVENGSPFLFKNGEESVRRMRSFLGNVLDTDIAHTVDLMKFILSYASNPSVTSERSNFDNGELVESSVRTLLSEFAKFSYSNSESNSFASLQNQSPDRLGQTSRPVGQKIEMKRGDWICQRCSFMNFARNMKCLECEETRPKRELTGGEWECPQCDFFNYGRNMVCLRCDCKRPGEVSLGNINTTSGVGFRNGNKVDIDSRLAANEEKAQRWFSKVSQLDSTSDMSSAITDEDFPEIMPLRKGVNRFVVSTRKTPLERRLANAQYRRNLGNDGTPEGNDSQGAGANMTINRSLDAILGRTSAVSESNNKSTPAGEYTGSDSPQPISGSASRQYGLPRGSNSNFVPFVPLPSDMFAKKPENSKTEGIDQAARDKQKSVASNAIEWTGNASGSSVPDKSGGSSQHSEDRVSQNKRNDTEKEQAEKSERWFKKVAELHNVTDLASAISDEDFPEIMPMRKGENRFVVSKKKDRSLTSPAYKRRMAIEQGNSTDFVPFVPFPPDYFAKKDKPESEGADLANKAAEEASSVSAMAENDSAQQTGNPQISLENWNAKASGENLNESKTSAVYRDPTTGNSTETYVNAKSNSKDNVNSWYPEKENTGDTPILTSSPQPSENQNARESWTGKSLEGSLVKEPNPLDLSEEAKAERWFRRVAQIKDISELSQIPDEDFPSIMPMRKGVNRFVVSKRKTPLERRLTSPQYRRNLPTVSSDPVKKETDGS